MMKYVYCRTRFIGFHCWPDAPASAGYLRSLHRHEFHVQVVVEVEYDNRDVEFITLKQNVDGIIGQQQRYWEAHMSCEMMAHEIAKCLRSYKVHSVDVSEDGENGARIVY